MNFDFIEPIFLSFDTKLFNVIIIIVVVIEVLKFKIIVYYDCRLISTN
jgi:hypothetical protein